jgi:hypothetical protein
MVTDDSIAHIEPDRARQALLEHLPVRFAPLRAAGEVVAGARYRRPSETASSTSTFHILKHEYADLTTKRLRDMLPLNSLPAHMAGRISERTIPRPSNINSRVLYIFYVRAGAGRHVGCITGAITQSCLMLTRLQEAWEHQCLVGIRNPQLDRPFQPRDRRGRPHGVFPRH